MYSVLRSPVRFCASSISVRLSFTNHDACGIHDRWSPRSPRTSLPGEAGMARKYLSRYEAVVRMLNLSFS